MRRHGRQLQEPVEAQVALAEHWRRREVDDRLLVEPLRDRHALTDAIEVDRERADTQAPELRDALSGAHQARDVVIRPQPQCQPLADVAAAGDEDVTALRLH